jgi:HAD superfamily hydrolase (TIGR01549 family)
MSYRAVLFDVGGPIDLEFAWETAMDGAIASACGLEGIRVDQALIEQASDRAVAAFAPDAYAHMVETLCAGDPQACERVRRRVRAMVGNLDVFQLRPDIDGLLRRLRERGLGLGIVANQPEKARERLARAGIGDCFDYHGLSGLTGFSKPDPRAFLAAAEKLGVPPAACIMVGDRIDNDIAPAKALGMAAILFRSGRHRRQRPRSVAEDPDAVVTDVLELEQAIGALLAQCA